MENFLRTNSEHPYIVHLQTAIESDTSGDIHKWMSQISADNWHDFLGGVKRSDTRAIYAFLAKMEGRRQMNIQQGDLAPLIRRGQLITGDRSKC